MTPPLPLGRREGARDGAQAPKANASINHAYEASIKTQMHGGSESFQAGDLWRGWEDGAAGEGRGIL